MPQLAAAKVPPLLAPGMVSVLLLDHGMVAVKIKRRRGELEGELELKVQRLASEGIFEVVLDGVRIGSLTTNRRGAARVRFRTRRAQGGVNLGPGTCAPNPCTATMPARATIGDEVEFDFDSDGGDIGEGAPPIAAGFIQGTPPTVTGRLLGPDGGVVAEATVPCQVR
jgi:hypothetical protein